MNAETSDKLRKNKQYLVTGTLPFGVYPHELRAKWTGENRFPRCGEWYLECDGFKGYIVRQSSKNMSTSHPIPELRFIR